MILYGIKRVVLTELNPQTGLPVGEGGIVATINTAEEATLEPVFSEGNEEILRNDTNILAVVRTDDLLYGYDITFKDNQLDLKAAQLLGGYKVEEQDDTILSTPLLADGAVAKPFKMEIYVANYEGDAIVGYAKITLNKCFGKFPSMQVGKEFYAPEFEVKARENSAASLPIKQVETVPELPQIAE